MSGSNFPACSFHEPFLPLCCARPHRMWRKPGNECQTLLTLGGLASKKQVAHEEPLPRREMKMQCPLALVSLVLQSTVRDVSSAGSAGAVAAKVTRGHWAPTLSEPGAQNAGGRSTPVLPGQGVPISSMGHTASCPQAFLRKLILSRSSWPEMNRGSFPQSHM